MKKSLFYFCGNEFYFWFNSPNSVADCPYLDYKTQFDECDKSSLYDCKLVVYATSKHFDDI